MGVFVKICGVTSVADARAAVDAGADAIGLNFVPSSRRRVELRTATAIVEAVSGEILTVGVFRDHLADEVVETVAVAALDAAQLHGDETVACSRAVHEHVPILVRGLSVDSPAFDDLDAHDADVVLLDAPTPGGGVPFDWSLVGDLTARHRVLLAGGLRPETVADAVRAVRPWGVDVATGVESRPGVKDHHALRRFVDAARGAADPDDDRHPPLPGRVTTS